MISADDIESGENEEVLFATEHMEVAEVPEGWDPDEESKRTWGEQDLELHKVEAAVIGNREEKEVVIRLRDGREYSYKRAIERAELGEDYVIPGFSWLVLFCNQTGEKAADIMGGEFKEGVERVGGTDVAIEGGGSL